jgi:hypothetical protein
VKAPVLFLNFNRPGCTSRSFEMIRKYKPDRLYISLDGPRAHVNGDIENVATVKKILSEINWDCEVYRNYYHVNQGCKKAVQKSLAWFFKNEEMGIILEDDCIPSSSFFRFTEELLAKYKDDERIAVIHGNAVGFKSKNSQNADSYFFTQFMNMWGWATWRRTFTLIDNSMSLLKAFDNKMHFLDRVLSFYGTPYDKKWNEYWCAQFCRTAFGQIDTWDYQWIFNILEKRKVCISPSVNMVENIGWGPGATHTLELNPLMKKNHRSEMHFPLKHPDVPEIHVNAQYEAHIKEAWCDLTRFHDLFLGSQITKR